MKSEILLNTTAGIDLGSTLKQPPYTVLAGKTCIVTKIVARNVNTGLSTVTYGWNANADDVIAAPTYRELTGFPLYTIKTAKSGAAQGAAGGVFRLMIIASQAGATWTEGL